MSEKSTAYCIKCGSKLPYSVYSSRETMTVKGVTFSYVEKHARCQCCGTNIYVPEINDENVQSLEDGFRKASKLITVSELNELLSKYNIGAGPLAKLLGFGDVTINRYVAGQLPSRHHSDLLLQIRASHKTMEEYLEAGKDLITQTAYTKCRKAIDSFNHLYGSGKIELVARYIYCKTIDITPLALQKLLYYAQAFFKALFHEDLFSDDCQAWSLGPVFPEIYYEYKDRGYESADRVFDSSVLDFSELTTREIALLDAVIGSFGQCSGQVLSKITHKELPWIEARGTLLPEDRCVTIIKRDTINEYFHSVVSKYQIVNPCDIAKYCTAMRSVIS